MGTCGDRCDGERQDKKEMRGKYFAEHRGAGLEREGGLKYLSEERKDDKRKTSFKVSLKLGKEEGKVGMGDLRYPSFLRQLPSHAHSSETCDFQRSH